MNKTDPRIDKVVNLIKRLLENGYRVIEIYMRSKFAIVHTEGVEGRHIIYFDDEVEE